MIGIGRAYPEVKKVIDAALTPKGRELYDKINPHCGVDMSAALMDAMDPSIITGGLSIFDNPVLAVRYLFAVERLHLLTFQ